ncbi:MAG: hypothetical protein ACUVQS_02225 [Candidatus Bipolaricaulaceae bacterium]
MKRALWVMVILVGLCGTPVWARTPEEAVLPEWVVGTLAGYAGGMAGALILGSLFAAGTGDFWEQLGLILVGVLLGYTGGAGLGASFGVITTGSFLGVQGNVGLAYLGGVGAAALAAAFSIALDLEAFLWLVPPAAAAGATLGFNVGVRIP